MGLFAIAEIITNLENPEKRVLAQSKVTSLWPTRDDFRRSWPAVLRGTGIGSLLGILPGGGAMLASFAAYSVEKRLSAEPERFGHGAVEGVAAPESANNAGAQTSFIPLLTLGIPANAVIALMAGAMMIHGVQPGPQVMTKNPELFWGVIASMLIGNIMLVIINLPLIQIWVTLLKVPYHLFYPAILVFCCIGVYTLNNSVFEVLLLVLFGFVGYLFMKWRCEPAPLLLAFVLGPLMEENLRRALVLSYGDATTFITRPISATLLLLALGLLILVLLPTFRRTRQVAFDEGARSPLPEQELTHDQDSRWLQGDRARRLHHRAVYRHAARRPRRGRDQGGAAGHRRSLSQLRARLVRSAIPGLQPQQAQHPDRPRTRVRARGAARAPADADVYIQNHRPGVIEKLGFAPERRARAQPASGLLLDHRFRRRTVPTRIVRPTTPWRRACRASSACSCRRPSRAWSGRRPPTR